MSLESLTLPNNTPRESLVNLFEKRDIKIPKFNNLKEFVDYVLIECSNCVNKESRIKEIENSKLYNFKDKKNCKEIKTSELTTKFSKKLEQKYIDQKRLLVLGILELFQAKGLLTKRGKVYYLLGSHKRLSWNNIKSLANKHIKDLNKNTINEIRQIFNGDDIKYDVVTLIKCLFWYLRKAVVDSLLSDIINYYRRKSNEKIVAVSVGSTKLSSDYDISLDTKYEIGALIIKKFTKLIESIFKDDSENIFDTNVYGVSFTKHESDNNFTEYHECDSNQVYYIPFGQTSSDKESNQNTNQNTNQNIEISQMIWCYIKLLLKLSFVLKQDDKVYEKLYSYLDNDVGMENNKLFIAAVEFINKYKSNVDNYGKVVSLYNTYINDNYKIGISDDNYLISNFISFVNYNGSETYLTNGAFMDVVINQQLCANDRMIEISRPYMYFTSFIENISDLLTHYHKSKYTERCENSLNGLNELLKSKIKEWDGVYSDTRDLLKWLRVTQKKCDDDVYKCQVFDLMYTCIYIITKVSNIYYQYVKETYPDLIDSVNMFSRIKFLDIEEDIIELSPTKV